VIVAAVPGSLLIRRALTDETRREPLRAGPAPAFSLEATDGTPVSSSDLAGRPAVVHDYASWCKPCRDEVAVLDATRRSHPALTVVGVVVRDDPAEAGRAARDLGLSWPLLVDPDEQAARGFGVDSAPVTFFISAEGRITGRLIGPVSRLLMDRQLERIL
jgi:cytochrome c biogenesis protein CcmG/thiol:disulfide interchange protein DsbE